MQATGVDIIDGAIGGIAPGLPLVLAGPSGCGRTVMALQLTAAALDRGEVVSYLCNEPSPFLLQQAATLDLGVDFEAAVERSQLVLMEMDPQVAGLVRGHGTASLVEALRAEEPLSTTLVIDPVTALLSEIHDEAAMRAETREMIRCATPMKIVLTVEAEQVALQRGLDRVLSEVSGASLSLSRNESSGRRWLRVDKSRNGMVVEDDIAFIVGQGGAQPRPGDPAADPGPGTWAPDLVAGAVPIPPPSDAVPVAPGSPEPSSLHEGPTAPDAPRVRRRPAQEEPKETPVVLVVDNDAADRQTVCKWLEGHHEVVAAQNGFEAMTCVAGQRPDLIILDLVLPKVTGYELLVAFQRVAEDVPVLVTSSRMERPADRIGPLVLGATDILTKPVDRFELLHKVELLMHLDGPPRRWLDPGEAEALFATVSETRRLDEEDFLLRMDRAHRFGVRHGMAASLVTVAGPSAEALDQFEAALDANLRFEDALLRVSKRRAVLLLVATDPAEAGPVVERLLDETAARCGQRHRFETQVFPTRPRDGDGDGDESVDWHRLFRDAEEEEQA
ncbi:MAG: response regulator [Myxococcota bacterium]